jgi:hypothetical protein
MFFSLARASGAISRQESFPILTCGGYLFFTLTASEQV